LVLSKFAVRALELLPVDPTKRIRKVLDQLKEEPRPPGCKKLKGLSGDLWRIRVGNYRIVYAIDDTIRIIDVRQIGDRKDVYKN